MWTKVDLLLVMIWQIRSGDIPQSYSQRRLVLRRGVDMMSSRRHGSLTLPKESSFYLRFSGLSTLFGSTLSCTRGYILLCAFSGTVYICILNGYFYVYILHIYIHKQTQFMKGSTCGRVFGLELIRTALSLCIAKHIMTLHHSNATPRQTGHEHCPKWPQGVAPSWPNYTQLITGFDALLRGLSSVVLGFLVHLKKRSRLLVLFQQNDC